MSFDIICEICFYFAIGTDSVRQRHDTYLTFIYTTYYAVLDCHLCWNWKPNLDSGNVAGTVGIVGIIEKLSSVLPVKYS